MKTKVEAELNAGLERQLELYKSIYQETVSLAAICAEDVTDQAELDRVLLVRQQLIEQTIACQSKLQPFFKREQGGDSPLVKDLLREIRTVLENTVNLEKAGQQNLEVKKQSLKRELLRIDTGRRANKAYAAPVKQYEGYFLDHNKN